MATEEVKEAVNHPAHYGGENNPFEAIKVIENWQLGFSAGNALKYILRAKNKGAELQDLKKALWYLRRWRDRGDTTVAWVAQVSIAPMQLFEHYNLDGHLSDVISCICRKDPGDAVRCMMYELRAFGVENP
jgi:hypothetical protein